MQGDKYNELESQQAAQIEAHYVCAQCWGTLITQHVKGEGRLFKVLCPNCGEDRGFVTRDYAEKRRSDNKVEAVEAKHNLGKILGLPEKPFDREKVIDQMWPE